MIHVKTLVIIQLKSAFAYFPTGCTYATGITCSLLVLCAVWKFCLHKKVPRLFWWRLLVGFLFIVYMYCVLQLTIFSREPGNYGAVDWRFLVRWNENDAQEALQLKYQLGFCQLDDVVANSAGFLIGYLIFLAIRDVYLFIVMLFRLLAAICAGHR